MTGQELKGLLRNKDVNMQQLAQYLGITPQGLNSIFNRKSIKIERLQDINRYLESEGLHPIIIPSTSTKIPILDVRASAGNGISLEETENIIGYVDIPSLRGCFGLQVYGDSMRGKFDSGDTIFVRRVTDKQNIQWGQCYVVKTESELFIKLLYSTPKTNEIRLVSYNAELTPSGERAYPDRTLHVNGSTYLYKVEGNLKLDL